MANAILPYHFLDFANDEVFFLNLEDLKQLFCFLKLEK